MLPDVDAAADSRAIPVGARRRGAKVVASLYATVLLSACTVNPYVIGAYASAADGGTGTVTDGSPTFAASLSRSGTSRLAPSLVLLFRRQVDVDRFFAVFVAWAGAAAFYGILMFLGLAWGMILLYRRKVDTSK